jgi:hypothetical protein
VARAARNTVAAAETFTPAAGFSAFLPRSPRHHLALCPKSPHRRHLARFLHSATRCYGERHLKHLPLAFLNSSALNWDMG